MEFSTKDDQCGVSVDVCSYDGKWYAGKVIKYFENGDARIRFFGWGIFHDERIKQHDISRYIKSLYSRSPNRLEWKVGDSIDVLAATDSILWIQTPIIAVNKAAGKITVQPSRSAVTSAVDLNRSATSVECISTDKREFDVLSHYVAPLGTFTHRGKRAPNTQNAASTCSDYVSSPVYKKVKSEDDIVDLTDCDDAPPSHICSTFFSPSAPHTSVSGAHANTPTTVRATPPSAHSNTDTWLAPLLRARHVSEEHIQLCEHTLVRDEGFTTPTSFTTGISASELEVFLKGLGTMPRGLQANVRDVHHECAGLGGVGGVGGDERAVQSRSGGSSSSKNGGAV